MIMLKSGKKDLVAISKNNGKVEIIEWAGMVSDQ
jgi:hypothetical protein